jgi:hypothetical protein
MDREKGREMATPSDGRKASDQAVAGSQEAAVRDSCDREFVAFSVVHSKVNANLQGDEHR